MSWDDPHAWRASYDAWKLDAMDAYSYGDGPSMESVRAAISAVTRMVVTTVSMLRFSGGRPIRRFVPDSIANVKSDLHNVNAYLTCIT